LSAHGGARFQVVIDRLLEGRLETRLVVGSKFHVIPGKVQLACPDGIYRVEVDR
jgi:hypothetical protein